jgi:hypothetical protein
MREKTARVYHNTDGTKQCRYIGASGTTNLYWGSFNFSATVTLPAITRACAVSTTAASSVGGTSATVGGNVTDAGLPPSEYTGATLGNECRQLAELDCERFGAGIFSANYFWISEGDYLLFLCGVLIILPMVGGMEVHSVSQPPLAAPSVITSAVSK